MNKYVLGLCFVVATAVCLPILSSSAYGQKGTKMKKAALADATSTTSSSGAKGATDPNIKIGERINSTTKEQPSSSPKSGAKGVSTCGIFFDNYTNLYIKVFVDGDYEGVVGRMGEKTAYAIAGATVVYARADFDDGSFRSWGPITFQCSPGTTYTWKLKM
jgi:hypothetical protein